MLYLPTIKNSWKNSYKIMEAIRLFFGFKKRAKPSSRFSRFFVEASSREQKKVIMEVARRANADQRRVYGVPEQKNRSR